MVSLGTVSMIFCHVSIFLSQLIHEVPQVLTITICPPFLVIFFQYCMNSRPWGGMGVLEVGFTHVTHSCYFFADFGPRGPTSSKQVVYLPPFGVNNSILDEFNGIRGGFVPYDIFHGSSVGGDYFFVPTLGSLWNVGEVDQESAKFTQFFHFSRTTRS